MKVYGVITSINLPTEAVLKFSEMKDMNLIVAGDQKTPAGWKCNNVTYLDTDRQLGLDYKIARKLPWNHYCRKMTGYLYAISMDADIIYDTDDDNIPYDDWHIPMLGLNDNLLTCKDKGIINIYQYFSKQKIWPRGLPLDLISRDFSEIYNNLVQEKTNVGIWQGLADQDPDVDAIYRMVFNSPCTFEKKEPVVLDTGTYCPINTQNTFFIKELFPLLYIPTTVTFRFCDILRGLIAQPILQIMGYQLGFFSSTVYQKRNDHDFYKDFISEIPMYESSKEVINIVLDSVRNSISILDNIYNCYNALQKASIVKADEMGILESWLEIFK
jgi:hypothetical protein